MKKSFKKSLVAAAASLAFASPAFAADLVTFDSNGSTSGGTINTLISFDPAAGTALAVDANNANQGLIVGDTFQLFYQANMISGLNQSGVPVNLGANFTVVAGFQETVTSLTNSATTATFGFQSGGTNFFYICAQGPGDPLAGTGFGCTAANAIMTATVTTASGNFTVTTSAVTALDSSGNNDWPGTSTVQGVGTTAITATVLTVNSGYFTNLSTGDTITLSFNTSQKLAFEEVDPSRLMFDGTGTFASDPGTVNGAVQTVTRDVMFQADANFSITTVRVPEPASLALVGIALTGLGWVARRRKSEKSA